MNPYRDSYNDPTTKLPVGIPGDLCRVNNTETVCYNPTSKCCVFFTEPYCCSKSRHDTFYVLYTVFLPTFFLTLLAIILIRSNVKAFFINAWCGPFLDTDYTITASLLTDSYLLRDKIYYELEEEEEEETSDSFSNYMNLQPIDADTWHCAYFGVSKLDALEYHIRVFDRVAIEKYGLREILLDKTRLLPSIRFWLFSETKSVFVELDSFYIVSKRVYGWELSKILNRHKRGLPDIVVKFITAQVVVAVEYLHGANVLVRDIHADCIIVQSDGYIKIVNILSAEVLDIEYSVSTNVRGRIFFAPPEFIGEEIWTKESDWWAFGIFLFHLAVGKTPFESQRGLMSTMVRINLNKYEFPGGCSKLFKHLIRGLLNPSMGMRYAGIDVSRHRWFLPVDFHNVVRKSMQAPPKLLEILTTNAKTYV